MFFAVYHILANGGNSMGRVGVFLGHSGTMDARSASIRSGYFLAMAAWATEFQIYASLLIHLKMDLGKVHSAG